ncbi:unnamed protein product [Closterium sp. Naga37s-1]|nr:unnamed protein product [Closterium sp. Naga37s-1]
MAKTSKSLWGHLDALRGTSDKLACLLLPDGSIEMFGAGKRVADILAEYPGYHVGSLTSSRPRLAPQKVLRPGSTYHLTPVVSADGENGPLSPGGNGGEGTPRLRRESASFLRPTEAFGEVANDVALVHEGPHRGPSRRVSLDPGSLQRHATGSPRTSTRWRVIPRDPFTGLPATHEGSQPAESQPESQPELLSAAMVRAALTGSETQRSSAEETMWTPHMQHSYAGVQGAPSVQIPPQEPQQQQDQEKEQQGSTTKVAVLERQLPPPRGNQRKLADSPVAAVFPDFAVCYDIDEDSPASLSPPSLPTPPCQLPPCLFPSPVACPGADRPEGRPENMPSSLEAPQTPSTSSLSLLPPSFLPLLPFPHSPPPLPFPPHPAPQTTGPLAGTKGSESRLEVLWEALTCGLVGTCLLLPLAAALQSCPPLPLSLFLSFPPCKSGRYLPPSSPSSKAGAGGTTVRAFGYYDGTQQTEVNQLNTGRTLLNPDGTQQNTDGFQLNTDGTQLNSGGDQLNSGGNQLNSGGDQADNTIANANNDGYTSTPSAEVVPAKSSKTNSGENAAEIVVPFGAKVGPVADVNAAGGLKVSAGNNQVEINPSGSANVSSDLLKTSASGDATGSAKFNREGVTVNADGSANANVFNGVGTGEANAKGSAGVTKTGVNADAAIGANADVAGVGANVNVGAGGGFNKKEVNANAGFGVYGNVGNIAGAGTNIGSTAKVSRDEIAANAGFGIGANVGGIGAGGTAASTAEISRKGVKAGANAGASPSLPISQPVPSCTALDRHQHTMFRIKKKEVARSLRCVNCESPPPKSPQVPHSILAAL